MSRNLVLQLVDVSEFACSDMRVKQVTDAEATQPALTEILVHIAIKLPVALAVILSLDRRRVGARGRNIGKIVCGDGIDTGPRRRGG